jgi:hypothetical protein
MKTLIVIVNPYGPTADIKRPRWFSARQAMNFATWPAFTSWRDNSSIYSPASRKRNQYVVCRLKVCCGLTPVAKLQTNQIGAREASTQ